MLDVNPPLLCNEEGRGYAAGNGTNPESGPCATEKGDARTNRVLLIRATEPLEWSNFGGRPRQSSKRGTARGVVSTFLRSGFSSDYRN